MEIFLTHVLGIAVGFIIGQTVGSLIARRIVNGKTGKRCDHICIKLMQVEREDIDSVVDSLAEIKKNHPEFDLEAVLDERW